MSDKQLGLGQYKLHLLTDMEEVPTAGEIEFMLTDEEIKSRRQLDGTVQQQIADIDQALNDYESRYLTDIETNYNDLVQETLPVEVPVETNQAQLGEYKDTKRVAAD